MNHEMQKESLSLEHFTSSEALIRNDESDRQNLDESTPQVVTEPSFCNIEGHLNQALVRDELLVYYQPQVDIQTGKVVGSEALLRWKHPTWGIVEPAAFIHLAEKNGLIIPIGESVLRTACAQTKVWQDMGYAPMVISVNLSPRQLTQSNIVQIVKRTLEQTSLAPEYLHLEITESIAIDVDQVMVTLQEIRDFGVRISMDDFGKGYNSLSYLKQLPLDTLKIDKSFVHDCTEDAKDATIVKSIISMAHNMNLKVIAEGVETKEHLLFLQQHLCNVVQGYLFSKPLPAEELQQKFSHIPNILREHGMGCEVK